MTSSAIGHTPHLFLTFAAARRATIQTFVRRVNTEMRST
jgi:hypothetical protein